MTLGLIDKVQIQNKIDLAPDNNDISPVTGLLFQPRQLGSVLWTCIESQAESAGVKKEDFIDSLGGEELSKGWGAVVDAIVFFTQSRSQKAGEAIAQAVEAELKVHELQAEMVLETIKSQETDEEIRKAAEKIRKEMQGELTKELRKDHGKRASS